MRAGQGRGLVKAGRNQLDKITTRSLTCHSLRAPLHLGLKGIRQQGINCILHKVRDERSLRSRGGVALILLLQLQWRGWRRAMSGGLRGGAGLEGAEGCSQVC